jgi:hypothetical protein
MIETGSIETGLVYIYSVPPARDFVGCGALIEGGYIAACRHVWRDAIDSEDVEASESSKVEIVFPFAQEQDPFTVHTATLADACKGLTAQAPDLVLLKPNGIPDSVMKLQLARKTEYEIGSGQCHCYLKTQTIDDFIRGEIDGSTNAKGMRKFTGDKSQDYFVEDGSSGSPVFRLGGQQLAGIISLAETGANNGKTHLRVAFVVLATTIHKYLQALTDRLVAIDQRSNSAEQQHVRPANSPAISFEHEAQIEAVMKHASEKSGKGDRKGALGLLKAMIAKIELEQEPNALSSSQDVLLSEEHTAIIRSELDHEHDRNRVSLYLLSFPRARFQRLRCAHRGRLCRDL